MLLAAPTVTDQAGNSPVIAGDTLTATPGTWSGSPTSYSFQWYQYTTAYPVAGATSDTLDTCATGTPGCDDHDPFFVVVTAANAAGATTASSAQLPENRKVPGERSGDVLVRDFYGTGFGWLANARPISDSNPYVTPADTAKVLTVDKVNDDGTNADVVLTINPANYSSVTFQTGNFSDNEYGVAGGGYGFSASLGGTATSGGGGGSTYDQQTCQGGVQCDVDFLLPGYFDSFDTTTHPQWVSVSFLYVDPTGFQGSGSVYIPLVTDPQPPLPVINYQATGTVQQFRFDGSGSIPVDPRATGISNWAWDFGDGTTATGAIVDHTFASEVPSRPITLTVTDSLGTSATSTSTMIPYLRISGGSFTPPHLQPASSFTSSVTVENNGSATIDGVTPAASSADPTIASITGAPTPAFADIPPGGSQTFTFPAMAGKIGTTTFSFTATGSAFGLATAAGPTPFAVVVAPSDLSVSLALAPQKPAEDQHTTLTATVTNTTTTSQTVTSVTPTVTATPATNIDLGPAVPTSTAQIPPHGTATFTFDVVAHQTGTYSLEVDVSGTEAKPGDQTASATISLPVLSLVVNSTGDQPATSAALAKGDCAVADSGPGASQCTLRAAIQVADGSTGTQAIGFTLPGSGVAVISPTSALPPLTGVITVDGTTGPGGLVELDGTSAGAAPGLEVDSGTGVIRGMVIGHFAQSGVYLAGGTGDVVAGDLIGTDPTGATAAPNGEGVTVLAEGATIGGTAGTSPGGCTGDCDLISGNTGDGIGIGGSTAGSGGVAPSSGSATIVGDTIGTDRSGEVALGNGTGILIYSAATEPASTVGAATTSAGSAPGNLISGNTSNQVVVESDSSSTIAGNLVGTDRKGLAAIPTGVASADPANMVGFGVLLQYQGHRSEALIGGQQASAANVISGAPTAGVGIRDVDSATVQNDLIGTNAAGSAALPNGTGVLGFSVGLASKANPDVIDSDLISGNAGYGVNDLATVTGNRIGTDLSGTRAVANGVGVTAPLVGGARAAGSTSCSEPCNLVSGNSGDGIDSGTAQGNYVGTDITGTRAVPNGGDGINGAGGVVGGSSGAVARSTCDLSCNLVAGNLGSGVRAVGGTISGNAIGVSAAGTALPNGVGVTTGGAVTVGGPGDAGNRVSGNTGAGIEEAQGQPALVTGNAVTGNGGGIHTEALVTPAPPRVPLLASATSSNGTLTVTGNVTDLVTGGNFVATIDVYASRSCEPGPQGAVPLGQVHIGPVTDGSFSATFPGVAVSLSSVTATSTESVSTASGTSAQATSAFSKCAAVNGTATTPTGPPTPPATTGPPAAPTGRAGANTSYRAVGADGGIFSFGGGVGSQSLRASDGGSGYYGSLGGTHLAAAVVGMASTPDGAGYWLVGADGGVFAFGDAAFYGSLGGSRLSAPVVAMAATPDGRGYWLVAADGTVAGFGDAALHGSLAGRHLAAGVVGIAAAPDGAGYWLVAADGGVFAFGDAPFLGGLGSVHLARPVVGIGATSDGRGYWLAAADGGVFAFGDAPYEGSLGALHLNAPISGVARTPDGSGYWLVGADGGVFSFGDAGFSGSEGGARLDRPVVGITADYQAP